MVLGQYTHNSDLSNSRHSLCGMLRLRLLNKAHSTASLSLNFSSTSIGLNFDRKKKSLGTSFVASFFAKT